MTNPVSALQHVIDRAKLADQLSIMLDSARRVDENPTSTLKRLLRERAELIDLLRDLGVCSAEPFDHAFKEGGGPVAALRGHLTKEHQ